MYKFIMTIQAVQIASLLVLPGMTWW